MLEKQRTEVLSLVAGLDSAYLNKPPFPNKWSILQILAHVMTAEELSIRYMMKKVNAIDHVGNSGFVESLKLAFLNFMQRVPLKYNAPKVVVTNTPAELSLQDLIVRWDANRKSLKKLLDSIPENHSRKKIYKHVIVGRLDARQALLFFQEHFNHHIPQIHRILKNNSPITVPA